MKKTAKFVSAAILAMIVISMALYIVWRPLKPAEEGPPPTATIEEEIKTRGEALYRQKAYAPVIALYQKLLEKNPDSLELKEKLGEAYYAAGRRDEARALLEEVIGAGKGSEGARKIYNEIKVK